MFKTIRKWLQSEQRYTYISNDPRAARHWHNPADPVQADRIEAAAARREERAEKLQDWAERYMSGPSLHPTKPNIFYIAK